MSTPDDQRRKEIVSAAITGVREYLKSTRGAAACGTAAKVIEFGDGTQFEIECSDDTTIYFNTMEF